MSKTKMKCFVIMPFSDTSKERTEEYWTNHFEQFLMPTIEECPNVNAVRSEPLRGDILKQIITELVFCPIVVADLTDLNPNVFWELGVRQSFKHGTITIAEDGTKLPFDVRIKGTLFYHPKDHIKNAKFRKKLKKAINDCCSESQKPDSHVLETISGRGTLFQIIQRDESIRRIDALFSEIDHNESIYQDTLKQAKANQKDPEKRRFVTSRFMFSAAELLSTDRYLDKKATFYKNLEALFCRLMIYNDQLNVWESKAGATEKWFVSDEKGGIFKRLFTGVKSDLEKAKEKLERTC